MKKKVQNYIRQNALFGNGDKIIVAVSGGADSCVLLHLLLSMNYDCVVAHCNFHLRGEESMRDEVFVAQLAKQYNCRFLKTDFQTEEYAALHKISIEMAARDLRYRWFEEVRQTENATCIAVAHHQDDTAETILMNLARGTGINGLTGIKARNGNVVRPLLCVSRKEIRAYLRRHQLQFVEDSTNADTQFTRNYFRRTIIPDFEKINPSFAENVRQTAGHLSDVAIIYNEYIADAKRKITISQGEKMLIDIVRLKREKAIGSLLFELLKDYDFNPAQCTGILKSIDGISGKQFFSPTHRLVKDRDYLIISSLTDSADVDLKSVPNRNFRLKLILMSKKAESEMDKSPNVAYFDNDKITSPLLLRHWQKGDFFYPLGMKGKKKLISDYFTDKKYSLPQKEAAWVLLAGDDVIWVVGERIDDRYKITDETKSVLKVFY